MSNKAEQPNPGAAGGAMGAAERGAGTTELAHPDTGDAPTPTAALPSIIVDPTLGALADGQASARESHGLEHAASNGAGGSDVAPSNPEPDDAAAHAAASAAPGGDEPLETPELSTEDAERFAASFRASWEPPAPANDVRASTTAANPNAAVFTTHEVDPIAPGAFPGAAQRRRGMLMATAAIASFVALVALALVMSTRALPSVPAAAHKGNAAAPPEREPVAPTIIEPTRPIAQPAADPVVGVAKPSDTQEAPPAQPAAIPAVNAEPAAAAEPTANVQLAVAPTPSEGAEAAKPAPHVEPAPPPTVQIGIAASPAGARLTLDGTLVTNPFETREAKGTRHRLIAEAPGHRARDLTLTFDRDQTLNIKLERLKPARPAPVAVARPKAPMPYRAPATLTIYRATPTPTATQPAQAHAKGAGFVSESPY